MTVKPYQIRALPVKSVLELLQAGVYLEFGQFRVFADDNQKNQLVYAYQWGVDRTWHFLSGRVWTATIGGVTEMLADLSYLGERIEEGAA